MKILLLKRVLTLRVNYSDQMKQLKEQNEEQKVLERELTLTFERMLTPSMKDLQDYVLRTLRCSIKVRMT